MATLVDKKPVAIQGPGSAAIFLDVAREQLAGFGPQANLPIALGLAHDGERLVVGIEVVQIQSGNFTGASAGVKEQVQQAVIPEALGLLQIDGLKDLHDFFRIQVTDELLGHAFLRDAEYALGQAAVLGMQEADHFGQ